MILQYLILSTAVRILIFIWAQDPLISMFRAALISVLTAAMLQKNLYRVQNLTHWISECTQLRAQIGLAEVMDFRLLENATPTILQIL